MGLSSNKRSGRPWNDELTQLEVIAEIFIKVLLRRCPEEVSEHVFLEELFGIKERLIGKFKSKEKFEMPGLFCESPIIRIQGIGYRHVRRNQILHVRQDSKTPQKYEISFFGGVGGAEQWFELGVSDWLRLQTKLEPMDDDAKLLRFRDKTLK